MFKWKDWIKVKKKQCSTQYKENYFENVRNCNCIVNFDETGLLTVYTVLTLEADYHDVKYKKDIESIRNKLLNHYQQHHGWPTVDNPSPSKKQRKRKKSFTIQIMEKTKHTTNWIRKTKSYN